MIIANVTEMMSHHLTKATTGFFRALTRKRSSLRQMIRQKVAKIAPNIDAV